MLLEANIRIGLCLARLRSIADSAHKAAELSISQATLLGNTRVLCDLVVNREDGPICKVFELEVRL